MSRISKTAAKKRKTEKNKSSKKNEQSLEEMADEFLGGSDSDDSASKAKLSDLQGNTCEKERCECFLCRQCILVDKDRLRWALRKRDMKIKQLQEEIKKLKSKN